MNIGYYAHHHGSGHCRQADKLAGLLPKDCRHKLTVFTTVSAEQFSFSNLDEAQVVRLAPEEERDDDVLSGRPARQFLPDCLHYSPVGNRDIQQRSWQLLDGIRRFGIDLMIVDVSAEVAMLCRAVSIPYLYVRLAGSRDDAPHLNAFAGALGVLAPFPERLDSLQTRTWVRQKTRYLDFLTTPPAEPRLDSLITTLSKIAKTMALDDKTRQKIAQYQQEQLNGIAFKAKKTVLITVIKGFGGHKSIDGKLPELRKLWSEALIISLGPISDEARQYVDIAATVDDVTPFLAFSDYLLMACGLNAIAQAYPFTTPLIALPDVRPHDEQEAMAAALIEQRWAMSWAQFLQYSMTLDSTLLPSASKAPIDNQAACELMTSLAVTSSVKSWFKNWLLPQLEVSPKPQSHHSQN